MDKSSDGVPDVFDEHVQPVEVRVRVAGGGDYTLHVNEFGPGGLGVWMNRVGPRVATKGSEDYAGMHEDLIEMCVTRVGPDGPQIGRAEIDGWGPRLKQHLFNLCQRVNGLDIESGKREGKG